MQLFGPISSTQAPGPEYPSEGAGSLTEPIVCMLGARVSKWYCNEITSPVGLSSRHFSSKGWQDTSLCSSPELIHKRKW